LLGSYSGGAIENCKIKFHHDREYTTNNPPLTLWRVNDSIESRLIALQESITKLWAELATMRAWKRSLAGIGLWIFALGMTSLFNGRLSQPEKPGEISVPAGLGFKYVESDLKVPLHPHVGEPFRVRLELKVGEASPGLWNQLLSGVQFRLSGTGLSIDPSDWTYAAISSSGQVVSVDWTVNSSEAKRFPIVVAFKTVTESGIPIIVKGPENVTIPIEQDLLGYVKLAWPQLAAFLGPAMTLPWLLAWWKERKQSAENKPPVSGPRSDEVGPPGPRKKEPKPTDEIKKRNAGKKTKSR
jgi:hypothetical protein